MQYVYNVIHIYSRQTPNYEAEFDPPPKNNCFRKLLRFHRGRHTLPARERHDEFCFIRKSTFYPLGLFPDDFPPLERIVNIKRILLLMHEDAGRNDARLAFSAYRKQRLLSFSLPSATFLSFEEFITAISLQSLQHLVRSFVKASAPTFVNPKRSSSKQRRILIITGQAPRASASVFRFDFDSSSRDFTRRLTRDAVTVNLSCMRCRFSKRFAPER